MTVKMTSVLVVDDQQINRQYLVKVLSLSPFIQVIGTAVNGNDAIRKVMALSPDVVTLDLEMPEMDGFTFLRWLMKYQPTPVLVISSNDSSRTVFKSMELGAVDFLVKPIDPGNQHAVLFRKHLISRIRGIAELSREKLASRVNLFSEALGTFDPVKDRTSKTDLVIIGASTGGPPAIQRIVASLPAAISASVVVLQHMPKGFTGHFAERLARTSNVIVREAKEGDELYPGQVLIGPGGYHLIPRSLGSSIILSLEPRRPEDRYVPSIDRFMLAAASLFGSRVLGVLLTGMGNDGVAGFEEIKRQGGITIAESEETAVVFGMPGEAIRRNVVDHVLSLSDIPHRIFDLM